MPNNSHFTLGRLAVIVQELLDSGRSPDSPVFSKTATGSAVRPIISAEISGESFMLSCAPPNATSWSGAVDWEESDSSLAMKLGISRQAVHAMRKRLSLRQAVQH